MRHLVALQQLERHLWRKPAAERHNGPPVKNLSAADLNSSVYRARGFDPFILVLLKLTFSHSLWGTFFGNKVSRWCTCLNGHVRSDQCCSSLRSMMMARARLYRSVFFTLYALEVQFMTRQ